MVNGLEGRKTPNLQLWGWLLGVQVSNLGGCTMVLMSLSPTNETIGVDRLVSHINENIRKISPPPRGRLSGLLLQHLRVQLPQLPTGVESNLWKLNPWNYLTIWLMISVKKITKVPIENKLSKRKSFITKNAKKFHQKLSPKIFIRWKKQQLGTFTFKKKNIHPSMSCPSPPGLPTQAYSELARREGPEKLPISKHHAALTATRNLAI